MSNRPPSVSYRWLGWVALLILVCVTPLYLFQFLLPRSWDVRGQSLRNVGSLEFTAEKGRIDLQQQSLENATQQDLLDNTVSDMLFKTASSADAPTEKMRITGAGLVGIGTASPGYRLDIQTSSSAAQEHALGWKNSAGTRLGLLTEDAGTYYSGALELYQNDSPNTVISANGNSYFMGGRIGINNNAPTVNQLCINATTSMISLGTADASAGAWIRNDGAHTVFSTKVGSMYYGIYGSSGLSHIFYSSSTYLGIWDTTGLNVAKLYSGDIRQTWSGTTTNYTEYLSDGGGNYFGGTSYDTSTRILSINSKSANTGAIITLRTGVGGGYAERMRISAAGYVGINNTSPTENMLCVNSGASQISFGGSYPTTGAYINNTGTDTVISTKTGSLYWGYQASASLQHIFYSNTTFLGAWTPTGFGIGTGAPTSLFHVVGSLSALAFMTRIGGSQVGTASGTQTVFCNDTAKAPTASTTTFINTWIYDNISLPASVVLTNNFGMLINMPAATLGASASITNNTALFVDAPTTGTNKYGAVFMGKVGIANAAPTNNLDVTGTAAVTGQLSGLAQYGEIYSTSSATFIGSTSAVKVTAFTAELSSGTDVTPSHANDRLTINTTGLYQVSYNISGYIGTADAFFIQLHVNGSIIPRTRTRTGNQFSFALSWSGVLSLTADDYLEIYGATGTGATADLWAISLYATRIN